MKVSTDTETEAGSKLKDHTNVLEVLSIARLIWNKFVHLFSLNFPFPNDISLWHFMTGLKKKVKLKKHKKNWALMIKKWMSEKKEIF